jgi:hypothetical protein
LREDRTAFFGVRRQREPDVLSGLLATPLWSAEPGVPQPGNAKTFEQKFNAVQMSAVFHAVRLNQDLVGPAFHEGDFLRPKEDYWANVDWVVEQTTRRGLVAILNPIWKKQLAAAIQDNGPARSRAYGPMQSPEKNSAGDADHVLILTVQ